MIMKILFVTPYITSIQHPAFLRNQTGFGYMVHDIAEYVAKLDEVDLFASMVFTPEIQMDGFRVLKRSWGKLFVNVTLRCMYDGIRFVCKYRQPLKNQLRTLYMFASVGQLEHIVKYYDLVHIHGCSELTDATIKMCRRKKVPFFVTLHGLNSFEQAIKQHSSLRQYERDFLKRAAIKHWPVSFISTGNMNAAIELAGVKVDSFSVICNGCNITKLDCSDDVRAYYKLKSSDFVFVCVGNISTNKNQLQVARAWGLLAEEERRRCKILFVGRYHEDDEVVQFIKKNKLQQNLIFCGMQPKDKVANFYQAADATILASITEGFGLSIIEGFVYGKPNVTFADLPAIQDLHTPCAMVLATDRTDKSLSIAMTTIMHWRYDKQEIMNYARRFSFEKMAKKYNELYKQVRY